jgi:hypothetical protein
MITRAWRGDWYERLKERVKSHGFTTATAFTDAEPTASLLTLAKQLARERDVAALQLQLLLLDEADATGTVERCARDFLVREFHETLPEGWHTEWDDDAAFRRSGVYSSWCTALPDRYEQCCDRIWEDIRAATLPEGWLPAGPDDPILVEIFRKHWREPEQTDAPPE